MKTLAVVPVYVKRICSGDVTVQLWEQGDPFPMLGPSVGVDTETERFTETRLDPPVVVLGVFDAASMTCYVVYWQDIPEFMNQLCIRDVQQRYFNLGFDEQVLSNELDKDNNPLMEAIDRGRVRDMQIRVHLNRIANEGFVQKSLFSLAGCSKRYLGMLLDKGDGSDTSARLSFRRYNEDGTPYVITEEQARYLPYDCISTWCLGEAIPEMPTEVAHTKGMVVLAHISSNGFLVDPKVYDALCDKLHSDMDKYRDELVLHGFPDPYYDESEVAATVREGFWNEIDRLIGRFRGIRLDKDNSVVPGKAVLRRMLVYLEDGDDDPDYLAHVVVNVISVINSGKKSLKKPEQTAYDEMVEAYELDAVDTTGKSFVMPALAWQVLREINNQLDNGDTYLFSRAMEAATAYIDDHPVWLAKTKPVGPKKFFQEHVRKLLISNSPYNAAQLAKMKQEKAEELKRDLTPTEEMALLCSLSNIKLELTEKSGDFKLTLKDMWHLDDAGVTDRFLSSYTGFKHCEKLLSTYLRPDYIKADGKMHPRFTNVLRTGRTSCTNPNLQNLPSRDVTYPIKNMFCPPPGAVLCATDFSFLELCAFAQACYTRFHHSVMRDIINAGVDPHRWFAGVRDGLIDSDTSFARDPEKVKAMSAFLAENVSKEARQHAKAANFGSEVVVFS